jgi:predicted dehydrogenase
MDGMSDVGVALIGYGFVGENFHAPLIDATDGLKLAVISSSKPDKVHERFPRVTVANTPEAAIADASVDLVVIASPNTSHVPLATAALHAGKHVVVDKPFTITTDEARELATLAAAKALLLSVFHNRRWDADYLTLLKLIAANTLGSINFFESHIDRFRPEVRDRWREQAGPGSGLWYDLGPHMIDQALQLFGSPETVQATILAQRPGARTDDYAHVVLGYPGLQVVLHGTMLAAGGSPRFLVHGDKASWCKYGIDQQEPQLISGMRPGDAGWGIDPIEGTLFTGPTSGRNEASAESVVPNEIGAYEKYYAEIRDAIAGRGPNPVPVHEAILVMAVLEAAIESARTGERLAFRA